MSLNTTKLPSATRYFQEHGDIPHAVGALKQLRVQYIPVAYNLILSSQ